ncbi:MAG: acyl-CoA thioesterase [Candidatus Cloacimonetes bacterium]|nr:acyl-CoA thioesterase [Candidatus Cloacimonadota bacterium]
MEYIRKIFGYECDIYGHLNNANYLHLYEEARSEALECMNMDLIQLGKMGIHIYLSNITLSFLNGIKSGETVKIDTKMIKATRATSVWKQDIYNSSGKLCNTAIVKGAFIKNGEPFRISNEIFNKYKDFLQPEDLTE